MIKPYDKTGKRMRRHARTRARMSGTAERPRLIVFRSNMNIYAQMIDDSTGKTLVSFNDLKIKKGTKTERASEVGKAVAESAKKAKIETCVFRRNGYKYHGRVKALAEAAREAGLKF
jgi:ribosomal protein L18, bacterial type